MFKMKASFEDFLQITSNQEVPNYLRTEYHRVMFLSMSKFVQWFR